MSDNFLTSSGIVVLDFWASWCGPCNAMKPAIEAVSKVAKVVKINTSEDPSLAGRFSVMALPTVVILKDGKEVNRLVGLRSEKQLLEAVEAAK